MRKYKAVVCDIDGTILDANHQIPVELVSLFAQLQNSGVVVTLASARPTKSILDVARQLNLQLPVIALNGSVIVNQQAEIIYSHQFEFNKISAVLEQFSGVVVNSYSGIDWHASHRNDMLELEEHFVGFKAIIGNEFPESSNMIVLNASHAQLLEIQQYILANKPELSAVFSHVEYLHIAVNGICKANGISQFARLHQLELSDFVAFGDGENDITMLQQVGHGVAMGNASDRVKSSAKQITLSNDELGVVRYLENLLELGLIG